MTKCPECGEVLRVCDLDADYIEDGWKITVIRYYKCARCRTYFKGISVYECKDAYEHIEKGEKIYG